MTGVIAAAQLTTAGDGGPFAGPGLKPLFPSEMHGVMPLADAARRLDVSCGKRPAALPHARGASPRLSGQTLAGCSHKFRPHALDECSRPAPLRDIDCLDLVASI